MGDSKEEYAVIVDHVSKDFILPHYRVSSVKGLVTGIAKKHNQSKETQHALQDISFNIKQGEFFGIVGRNGSGKSTLLKMLAGIYQPTRGTIKTTGRLVPFIELGVGFNPELTGRENVYLNGAMLGFSRKQIEAMYEDIVAFAEIEKFMDQKLKNYSSGMQVRLAFSMAIRAEADILLVDEVLAVGDADFQRKCFDYFRQLKRQKKTVIFVSHDMNAVREYCERAVLIDESRMVEIGKATKIAGRYSQLFIEKSNTSSNQDGAKAERWGEFSAKFTKPFILESDGKIELRLEIKCVNNVDDPIVGYYFENEEGKQICGTNTQLLGHKLDSFKANQNYTVDFKMDNIFSDGRYTATVAILKDNGASVVDWWVDPAAITITKAQHIPYLVDVPVKVISSVML